MEYMTTKEASEKWGISVRYVQRLLHENRINGVCKYGRSWMIPSDVQKPMDPRKERKLTVKKLQKEEKISKNEPLPQKETTEYIFLTTMDLPKNDPDSTINEIEEMFRPLAKADIAFRRGDPEPAKYLWHKTARGDKTKLSVASLATAAAISSGDYMLYNEILQFLQIKSAGTKSLKDKALLSLPQTLAAVSMAAPAMTPQWLKECDFSLFSYELRPFLLFLHAMHLRNINEYSQMLGVAKAALTMIQNANTFTWLDVYLSLHCAVAANALGKVEESKRYLDTAISLGLPCGFTAPFADYLGNFGGGIESAIEQNYPQYSKHVVALWNNSFKNWMRFHNSFAKANIATVLSAQEYQTAYLIAHGETYAGAARRMHLSVSRIKNILAEVYSKLFIQNKKDLNSFIL